MTGNVQYLIVSKWRVGVKLFDGAGVGTENGLRGRE